MDNQVDTSARGDEQREVERLIEEAKRLPGVEEVLSVYAQIAPYTMTNLPRSVQRLTYALGGNA